MWSHRGEGFLDSAVHGGRVPPHRDGDRPAGSPAGARQDAVPEALRRPHPRHLANAHPHAVLRINRTLQLRM